MLTRLHTPCPVLVVLHSLHCALVFQCFFSCALIFNHALGYILKEKFLGPPICFRFWDFVVDTLFRHSTLEMYGVYVFLADYVLVLYFAFVIAVKLFTADQTADQTVFKSDGKGRGPGFCFPIK